MLIKGEGPKMTKEIMDKAAERMAGAEQQLSLIHI